MAIHINPDGARTAARRALFKVLAAPPGAAMSLRAQREERFRLVEELPETEAPAARAAR